LLGSNEIGKFNLLYGLSGSVSSGGDNSKKILTTNDNDEDFTEENES
jgi:hypothetical protein